MIPKSRKHLQEQSVFDLIEESVALLRSSSIATLAAYYVGAIPFWVAFLYFIADMSHSGYAAEHLGLESLGIAACFLWMKCWQTVFMSKLRSSLLMQAEDRWPMKRIYRMVMTQATWQSWGLLVRSIGISLMIPFGWISSFYLNLTLLGDGDRSKPNPAGRAWEQANLWIAQAHQFIAIMNLFGFFVLLNVFTVMVSGPGLLKSLFGIENLGVRNLTDYITDLTFWTAAWAIMCLCIDPIWRAAYVVRCFYGESIRSGDDLRLQLRRVKARAPQAAVLGLLCFLGVANAFGDTPQPAAGNSAAPSVQGSHVDPEQIRYSIQNVLERREFAWRLPKKEEAAKNEAARAWLRSVGKATNPFTRSLKHIWRSIRKWWESIWKNEKPASESPSEFGLGAWKPILWVLLVLSVLLLAFLVYRTRFWERTKVVTAAPTPVLPDLEADNVSADELPEEDWLNFARDLMKRGELRLALRAAYLAGIAHLGQRELITIARYKTNRDYDRELRRRARARDELISVFEENLGVFERSWYGEHEVTPGLFTQFTENLERMRAC